MGKSLKRENIAYLFEYDVLPNIILNISRIIILLIYFAIISNYFNILTTGTIVRITPGQLVLYTIIALLSLIIGIIASRIPLTKIRKHGQRERGPDVDIIKVSGLMITLYLLITMYIIALVSGII